MRRGSFYSAASSLGWLVVILGMGYAGWRVMQLDERQVPGTETYDAPVTKTRQEPSTRVSFTSDAPEGAFLNFQDGEVPYEQGWAKRVHMQVTSLDSRGGGDYDLQGYKDGQTWEFAVGAGVQMGRMTYRYGNEGELQTGIEYGDRSLMEDVGVDDWVRVAYVNNGSGAQDLVELILLE